MKVSPDPDDLGPQPKNIQGRWKPSPLSNQFLAKFRLADNPPRIKELCDRQMRSASMRLFILLAAACLFSCPSIAQTQNRRSDNKAAAKHAPFPLQLEIRVPFDPTVFPSGGHKYLFYELHLTNFMPKPVSLSRVEVLDADTSQPIAAFEAQQLEAMMQPLGGRTFSDRKERLVIEGGESAIIFMSLEFGRSSRIPNRLAHHVSTADSEVEGAIISTHHTELRVLGPPVEGADWLAEPALTKAEEADIIDVWRCAEPIPPEWYEFDYHGLERIVETIYQRRTMIRDLISSFRTSSRNPFPNWREN
jgi:hypothetical protein